MPVMPDTRIFGADDGGGVMDSPLKTLGAMMQIKEQQQAYEARRNDAMLKARQVEDDNQTRQALQQFGTPEEAIDHLWKTGRSDSASRLAKDVMGERTARWQASDAELKLNGDRLGHAAQLLGSVTDDASYQTIRPQVAKIVEPLYGKAINDQLPTNYDEAKIKQLIMAGTSRADQIQQQRQLAQQWADLYNKGMTGFSEAAKHIPGLLGPDGKPDPNVAQWSDDALKAQAGAQEMIVQQLMNAPNEAAYNDIIKVVGDNGGRIAANKFVGTWQPDPVKRKQFLQTMGMSVRESAAAETQKANAVTAAERAQHQGVQDENQRLRQQLTDARTDKREQRIEKNDALREERRGEYVGPARGNEEDAIHKQVRAAEDWLNEQYGSNRLVTKNADGTESAKDLNYKLLAQERKDHPDSKQASIANGYIERRVEAEDNKRTRLQRLPTMKDAALAAIASNDHEAYDKLEKTYGLTTNQVGQLEEIAPWPDRDVGITTQAARDRRTKRSQPILARLKDETITDEERAELQKKLRDIAR